MELTRRFRIHGSWLSVRRGREAVEFYTRVGRVVDPFGHHWDIGRPIEERR